MRSAVIVVSIAFASASGAWAADPGFGAVGSTSYEQLRFYQPGTSAWPTSYGTVPTDYCAGTDRCGEPMTFTSLESGAWSLSVRADDGKSATQGIVYQDLTPSYGGLGVVSLDSRNRVSGEDGIGKGETLALAFNHQVTLVGMQFFDTDHTATESYDRGTLVIDKGLSTQQTFSSLSLAGFLSSNPSHWFTGTTFTFGYNRDDDKPHGYYLGALQVMSIPEPGSLALAIAGLGVVGFARRRARRG